MLKYEITINLYWVEFTQDRFNLQYPLPGTVGVGRAKTNLGAYPGAWTDIVQLILILPFRDLPPLLKKKKSSRKILQKSRLLEQLQCSLHGLLGHEVLKLVVANGRGLNSLTSEWVEEAD